MKAKPVIVIILTLAIGFVLGMLTSAQLRFHKLKPVRMYSSEERFREGFYKTIQPDEKQKAKINGVLDKYVKINRDIQTNFRKELEESMNGMRKEIESNLTKEQIARLKEMDEKRREMIRQSVNNWDSIRQGGRRGFDRGRFPSGPPPGPGQGDSSMQFHRHRDSLGRQE
jgi:hypothetical protein